MKIRETKVNASLGSRLPSANRFPIREFLLKDANRAAPHMKVMKLVCGDPGLGPKVKRRKACGQGWDPIVDVGCVFHGHRPEGRVCSFSPVDGGMQEHSPGHSHDGSNAPFGFAILVVATSSSKLVGLSIIGWFVFKGFGDKGSSIV